MYSGTFQNPLSAVQSFIGSDTRSDSHLRHVGAAGGLLGDGQYTLNSAKRTLFPASCVKASLSALASIASPSIVVTPQSRTTAVMFCSELQSPSRAAILGRTNWIDFAIGLVISGAGAEEMEAVILPIVGEEATDVLKTERCDVAVFWNQWIDFDGVISTRTKPNKAANYEVVVSRMEIMVGARQTNSDCPVIVWVIVLLKIQQVCPIDIVQVSVPTQLIDVVGPRDHSLIIVIKQICHSIQYLSGLVRPHRTIPLALQLRNAHDGGVPAALYVELSSGIPNIHGTRPTSSRPRNGSQ
ncbi:hypothetical protein KC367_g250 [Hortaea werneckii]|nr:hypothetical protein KC367_g250 [Hortaea werneckii]